MVLIEVRHLTKEYLSGEEKVIALKEVTLDIETGEFVALVGPSGSGKSTLLTALGALSPPTSGDLVIDGHRVYDLTAERRADFRSAYIGFVFQQFHLVPYLTALENVMLPLAILKYSHREQEDKARGMLERVGLGDKTRRLPNQLSGGEQERVAIARAIVNQPPILLADEPTGALDSRTGEEIMELFSSLNQEGLTIIMVTHNMETMRFVGRVLHLQDGVVTREELKKRKGSPVLFQVGKAGVLTGKG